MHTHSHTHTHTESVIGTARDGTRSRNNIQRASVLFLSESGLSVIDGQLHTQSTVRSRDGVSTVTDPSVDLNLAIVVKKPRV